MPFIDMFGRERLVDDLRPGDFGWTAVRTGGQFDKLPPLWVGAAPGRPARGGGPKNL